MEALIREAFEVTPAPVGLRLRQIEEDLMRWRPVPSRRRAVSHLPWWGVGLVLAGAATAGWWAGSAWRQHVDLPGLPTSEPQIVPDPAAPKPPEIQSKAPTEASNHAPEGDARVPVIYRREAD